MEEKDVAKMLMTAGITLGLIGGVSGTSTGNALTGAGLTLMALAILLFPGALVDIIYEYLTGGWNCDDEQ